MEEVEGTTEGQWSTEHFKLRSRSSFAVVCHGESSCGGFSPWSLFCGYPAGVPLFSPTFSFFCPRSHLQFKHSNWKIPQKAYTDFNVLSRCSFGLLRWLCLASLFLFLPVPGRKWKCSVILRIRKPIETLGMRKKKKRENVFCLRWILQPSLRPTLNQ